MADVPNDRAAGGEGILRHPLLIALISVLLGGIFTLSAAIYQANNGKAILFGLIPAVTTTVTATATVTTTATATITVTASPAPSDSSTALPTASRPFEQADFVDQGGYWELRDDVVMRKQARNHTIFACGSPDGGTGLNCKQDTTSAIAEINVPEGYSTLRSYFGLADQSPERLSGKTANICRREQAD